MFFEQLRLFTTYIYVATVLESDSLFSRLLGDIVHWRKFIPIFMAFFDEVKTYFKNPRRYSREVVIIISAIVLTFLIIMLLIMTFLAIKKQYQIRKASRSVAKKIPREEIIRRSIITGSIIGVLLLALTVGSSQPSFCIRCHEIEKGYTEWEASSHKVVGCLGCHYEPGLFGYVFGNIKGSDNLLAHFFKGGEITRATVSNSSCLQCHNDIYSRTVVDEREIKVRHKDIIAGGLACTSCHAGIAHKTKTGDFFAMNACVRCHNDKVASSKCSTCHQQDIAYKPGQTLDDWPKQKTLRITCEGCHQPTTTSGCIRCHGLVLPHSGEFVQKHAMRSEETGGNLCYKCHWNSSMSSKRMCGCHNAEGEIHGAPEGWYKTHGSAVKGNGMGCNCHGLSFCARCHDNASAVYPGGANNPSSTQMHGGWKTGM